MSSGWPVFDKDLEIFEYENVKFEVIYRYGEVAIIREVLRGIGRFLDLKYTDEIEKRQLKKITHSQDVDSGTLVLFGLQ